MTSTVHHHAILVGFKWERERKKHRPVNIALWIQKTRFKVSRTICLSENCARGSGARLHVRLRCPHYRLTGGRMGWHFGHFYTKAVNCKFWKFTFISLKMIPVTWVGRSVILLWQFIIMYEIQRHKFFMHELSWKDDIGILTKYLKIFFFNFTKFSSFFNDLACLIMQIFCFSSLFCCLLDILITIKNKIKILSTILISSVSNNKLSQV
jgi:hypothetical protein